MLVHGLKRGEVQEQEGWLCFLSGTWYLSNKNRVGCTTTSYPIYTLSPRAVLIGTNREDNGRAVSRTMGVIGKRSRMSQYDNVKGKSCEMQYKRVSWLVSWEIANIAQLWVADKVKSEGNAAHGSPLQHESSLCHEVTWCDDLSSWQYPLLRTSQGGP